MSFLPAVKLWIWVSVLATLAGWTLSLVGQLNRVGYIVFAIVAAIAMREIRVRNRTASIKRPPFRRQKFLRRFRRPLPFLFTGLAVLVFIGGVLYAPTNHTGLSYRIPRVLHWLEAGQWHWIYTPNARLNTRACGIEWLSAPFFLFLKSDRALFLLNFFPFLLLPGLLFSVLTRLGARARVAWQWMWILPTGYVFLTQAGSVGNDAYPAVYALAAIDFACRAWTSRRPSDLWLSLLAISLLGGAKASNLPLTLPWLVLAASQWKILNQKPLATIGIMIIAALVSFLPTAALNIMSCGSWSGLAYESPGMEMKNPVVGIAGNSLLLLLNNLCPPFFPIANWWTRHALQIVPGFIVRPMNQNFEQPYFALWELPTEDWAGIGMGVTVLMIIAALWAAKSFLRRKSPSPLAHGISPRVLRWALITPWIALAAYGAKSGMVTPARLIAPYYPLLLPLLIVGAEQAQLVRRGWWKKLVYVVFAMAFAVLIVTPPRPLWPAKTILKSIVATNPESKFANRALMTYTVYSVRSDPAADVRKNIPSDVKVVGFVGAPDDLDISLWRPYGSRRVEQISPVENAEQIRARKISYAVVTVAAFRDQQFIKFDDWLAQTRGEVVGEAEALVSVSSGRERWKLIQFKD